MNKLYKLTLENSRLIFHNNKHAQKCKILLRIPPVLKWRKTRLTILWILRILNIKISTFIICIYICPIFMPPPPEKGAYCFATAGRYVGRSVSRSVCRPSVVRSISFDPFTWSLLNLVQGLHLMSIWSLLIFRSHVQRSRSKHSLNPSVLSAQSLLTLSLDHYQTWCRGCAQWVDNLFWFSGHMFKGQGQSTILTPVWCPLNIFWPLHLINTMSTLYILIPCLLALDRLCFYREDKSDFCTMGGIYVSETFLVSSALNVMLKTFWSYRHLTKFIIKNEISSSFHSNLKIIQMKWNFSSHWRRW